MHPTDDFTIGSRLSACLDLLAQMDDLLLGFQPTNATEARASKVPRNGGAAIVAEVARQCTSIAITRADPDTTVHRMLEALDEERLLREVIARYEEILARLHGARKRASSECWGSAMTFYALLRRLAAKEPALKAKVEPLIQHFRARRSG